MTKPRLTAYLSRSVADRLELACKRPGANRSALVEKALDRLLNPERDQQGEAALISPSCFDMRSSLRIKAASPC